ncbi:hypothetical protein J6590_073999 [Homalodisca vitripennis]|nr:hypothetical protein J6590_073999 [Homalodisca vitripennis]
MEDISERTYAKIGEGADYEGAQKSEEYGHGSPGVMPAPRYTACRTGVGEPEPAAPPGAQLTIISGAVRPDHKPIIYNTPTGRNNQTRIIVFLCFWKSEL